MLKSKGPLLFAANHPNSFLDGIVLTTLLDEPLHSLARGDAFKNKWLERFLRSIRLMPVYRTSEGVENLEHNYTTFASCIEAFRKKESVLIFSEGRCENEWHLRPLKKGTARLAIAAWENKVDLKVIPTAFNYSSFKKFGKEIHVYFGSPITANMIPNDGGSGKQLLAFNENLHHQLQEMVYEINPNDSKSIKKIFSIEKTAGFYILLIPALAGWILHSPLYYPFRLFTNMRFRKSGHYDSVLTSLLLLTYPFYLILLFIIFYSIQPIYGWLSLTIIPFTAWAAVQVKYQAGL